MPGVTNALNNSSSELTVDNLFLNGNTLSSTSGDLVVESDATNDIQFYNGTSTLLNMTSAGEMTMALQPAFLGYLPSNVTNATGDGTAYTLGSGTALTEVFDQGGNFTTAGVFTAPVTGRYLLCCKIRTSPSTIDGSMTVGRINLITSNRTATTYGNPANSGTVSGSGFTPSVSMIIDMDAMDTASVTLVVGSSTKTVTISGGSNLDSAFSGSLIC